MFSISRICRAISRFSLVSDSICSSLSCTFSSNLACSFSASSSLLCSTSTWRLNVSDADSASASRSFRSSIIATVSARMASSRSKSDGLLLPLPLAAVPLLRSDSRRCEAATRAETGVPVRVERVRFAPAAPGLLVDEGVDALGVGRCGVPVGVSRPVAGGFLTALAMSLATGGREERDRPGDVLFVLCVYQTKRRATSDAGWRIGKLEQSSRESPARGVGREEGRVGSGGQARRVLDGSAQGPEGLEDLCWPTATLLVVDGAAVGCLGPVAFGETLCCETRTREWPLQSGLSHAAPFSSPTAAALPNGGSADSGCLLIRPAALVALPTQAKNVPVYEITLQPAV